MSDEPTFDIENLPGVVREMARQLDDAIGHVPLSSPAIVPPAPPREFPARALRFYGPGQAPIFDG